MSEPTRTPFAAQDDRRVVDFPLERTLIGGPDSREVVVAHGGHVRTYPDLAALYAAARDDDPQWQAMVALSAAHQQGVRDAAAHHARADEALAKAAKVEADAQARVADARAAQARAEGLTAILLRGWVGALLIGLAGAGLAVLL